MCTAMLPCLPPACRLAGRRPSAAAWLRHPWWPRAPCSTPGTSGRQRIVTHIIGLQCPMCECTNSMCAKRTALSMVRLSCNRPATALSHGHGTTHTDQPQKARDVQWRPCPLLHAHLLAAVQRSRHLRCTAAPRLLAPDRHRLLCRWQRWQRLADGGAHCRPLCEVGARRLNATGRDLHVCPAVGAFFRAAVQPRPPAHLATHPPTHPNQPISLPPT